RTDFGKTDWQLFSAAIASSPSTRNLFINDIHAFIANGLNTVPFSDRYFVKPGPTDTGGAAVVGGYDAYKARSTVGGHFAVLAKVLGANALAA
ncbi:MAG: hypothetical protein L6R39_003472, partial [Caloplaca ligustica]